MLTERGRCGNISHALSQLCISSPCASGGIGRLAGFRCQCSQGRAGSTPASRTTSPRTLYRSRRLFLQKSPLTHFVAAPLQIEPAALGFDLVLGAGLPAAASFSATKPIKITTPFSVVIFMGTKDTTYGLCRVLFCAQTRSNIRISPACYTPSRVKRLRSTRSSPSRCILLSSLDRALRSTLR